MAVRNIAVTDTLETFRTEFNALCLSDFGDIADLSGSISATTLVGAMNETISIATSTAGFTIRDSSSTTQLIGGGDTLSILGTTNEIEAVVSATDTVTIGLPNAVSITTSVTAPTLSTGNMSLTNGSITDSSGAIAGFTSIGNALFFSGLKWIVMLAPLGVVFYMSFGINKMSASKAQTVFWVFAALMGLSLSWILLVYTGASVARVFFITSATFGAMSLYGYTTKRDLTKFGSFLMMGLIGIIIASLVNIFLKSSMMYFVISILGVLIFVGLTAYDTQKIKNMYVASDTGELMGKKAVMGALTLYLDFINLFIMLLRLFGQRR